jgi:membrane protease YdiL (CAAX protease family)
MKEKTHLISRLFLIVFVFWGLYRLIFKLPENLEEIVLKPLIWVLPTLFIVLKIEKRKLSSLGLTFNNFWFSISRGLFFSALFFLIGISFNFLKKGTFTFEITYAIPSLLIAFVTAFSEGLVFRGYIQNRFDEILKNSWAANIIATIGYCLIHLPITIFVFHYSLTQIFLYLVLTALSSFGSGVLFSWTGSLWASIMIHVFWSWPLVFFN